MRPAGTFSFIHLSNFRVYKGLYFYKEYRKKEKRPYWHDKRMSK